VTRRVIAHCDIDAFYASVELLRHPEFVGKPLVVAHNGPRAVVTLYEENALVFFDALTGTIIVAGQGDNNGLLWNGSNQVNDAAHIQLLSSVKGTSSLNLNGFSDTIGCLTLAAGTKVLTSGSQYVTASIP
jgi:hypothetical protein